MITFYHNPSGGMLVNLEAMGGDRVIQTPGLHLQAFVHDFTDFL
jgi:hypothetical protein